LFSTIGFLILTALLAKPGDPVEPGMDTSKFSGAAFVGYGMSIFDGLMLELYDMSDGSYVPVGARFLYEVSPQFKIGSEFEFCASPFTVDNSDTDAFGDIVTEIDVSMTTINFMGQFYPVEGLYIRAGVARYSGTGEMKVIDDGELEWTGKADFEPAFGFNGGIGYETQLSGNIFGGIEGVYHKVDLKIDESTAFEGDEGYGYGGSKGDDDLLELLDFDLSHWAIHVFVGTTF